MMMAVVVVGCLSRGREENDDCDDREREREISFLIGWFGYGFQHFAPLVQFFFNIEGNGTYAWKEVSNNKHPTRLIGDPMGQVQWEKQSYLWVTLNTSNPHMCTTHSYDVECSFLV